jgi:hypothetical protein
MRKAEKWMAKRFPTSEPSSLGSAGFQPVSGLGPSRPHQGASEQRHLGSSPLIGLIRSAGQSALTFSGSHIQRSSIPAGSVTESVLKSAASRRLPWKLETGLSSTLANCVARAWTVPLSFAKSRPRPPSAELRRAAGVQSFGVELRSELAEKLQRVKMPRFFRENRWESGRPDAKCRADK